MKLWHMLVCAIAVNTTMAQTGWSYFGEPQSRRERITDVTEDPFGYTVLCTEYDLLANPQARTRLLRLNIAGSAQNSRYLWDGLSSPSAYVLLPRTTNAPQAVLGALGDSTTHGAFFSHFTDQELTPIDSVMYQFDSLNNTFLDNAIRMPDDGILAALCGTMYGASWWNTQILMRTNAAGDSLDSDVRIGTSHLIPRSLLALDDDTVMVATLGFYPTPYFQQWSFSTFSKFNSDLDLVGGFVSQPFDGSSGPITFGNTLFDGLHLSRLESGNLIISGRPAGSSSVRTVVLKIGPSGEWKAVFTPQSEFPMDFPAALGSSALTTENGILLASMENFFMGFEVGTYFLPNHPNQVKVFKLDTALNVTCTNIVDGFAENAYYWVDRIKATSDGGYLLCGGRFDLDQPNGRMVGWVQKFGPDDCFTSIGKGFDNRTATVSPNPGTDRMRMQLNGPIVPGRLTLLDMNGREVLSGALQGNSAELDTQALAAGVYAYRVVGEAGATLMSGRWIKGE